MSDTLREAAQQALDALEYHVEQTRPIHQTSLAIAALRAALAEPTVKESLTVAGDTLPPLPEPTLEDVAGELWGQNIVYPALYTADQMRSYAAEALAAERERQHEQMRQLMSELLFDEPAAVAEPVAHLWQHSETGRTRVVMPDQVVTADATWFVVGPLYLAAPPQREPYDQTALGLCNACGWKAVGPDGCLNCAPQREREPLTDQKIEDLAHREAWTYRHSSDPHHSHTYKFNRACLLEFARKLLAASAPKEQ